MKVDRRTFLAGTGAICSGLTRDDPELAVLDHLVWLSANLDQAVELFAARTGIVPTRGGEHDSGTHNAIVPLGSSHLEIIAPLPGRTSGNVYVERAMRRPEPHLAGWCVRGANLERSAARLAELGVSGVGPFPMQRRQPTGDMLSWRLFVPTPDPAVSAVPFLIEWLEGAPPWRMPATGRLESFDVHDPQPMRARSMLDAIRMDVSVQEDPKSRLVATIEGPGGRVTLTS